jgi:hypothetical protein
MPTTAETIAIAKVSMFLAAQKVAKASLFGGVLDTQIAIKLYMERKSVAWKYAYQPANATDLVYTKNYLFDLCGAYAAKADIIVNGGNGGTVIGGDTVVINNSGGGGAFEGDLP